MTTHTLPDRSSSEAPRPVAEATPREIIGRLVATAGGAEAGGPAPLAVFCFEGPEGYIGGHVARLLPELARRGRAVHLFTRGAWGAAAGGVQVHAVGGAQEGDLVEQVRDYASRAVNAFLRAFAAGAEVGVVGYEWSAAPCLSLLRGLRGQRGALALHTLERQRSDGTSEAARAIGEIEREGLQAAEAVLVHDPGTAEVARQLVPECVGRVQVARELFDTGAFEGVLDPGAVKARYQVGPVDPVLLFVGDLEETYGPDVLLKAMPALLRHHPQARLVVVGDGSLQWPLRVYARYLLLEYAVRLVGDVQGQELRELIQASDVVVVPSRVSTPWWPILAGWAARRPVVATHEAARSLTEHEKDSVLVYPSENSVVWGVERVLYDAGLRQAIGESGRRKLEGRFGWPALAEQVEQAVFLDKALEVTG